MRCCPARWGGETGARRPTPPRVPGLPAALRGGCGSKADGVSHSRGRPLHGEPWHGTAWPSRGSAKVALAAVGLQFDAVRAALRVRGLSRLQHHGPVPEEDEETWERGRVDEPPLMTNGSRERASQPARDGSSCTPSPPRQHPGALQRSPASRLTLEGVDDGEDVEGDKAKDTGGEGEEDQCPGDAQQDAQSKEG